MSTGQPSIALSQDPSREHADYMRMILHGIQESRVPHRLARWGTCAVFAATLGCTSLDDDVTAEIDSVRLSGNTEEILAELTLFGGDRFSSEIEGFELEVWNDGSTDILQVLELTVVDEEFDWNIRRNEVVSVSLTPIDEEASLPAAVCGTELFARVWVAYRRDAEQTGKASSGFASSRVDCP